MAVRRLRAPRQDQAVLAEPPLTEVGGILARNRQRLQQAAGDLLGRPWADLRRQARLEALASAREHLRQSEEPIPAGDAPAFLMAGHQPELFHPGVWVKNFALQGVARQHGLTPINLVVDNDAAKATGLRFPAATHREVAGSGDISSTLQLSRRAPAYRLAFLPFDRGIAEEPYEERTVRDEGLFASFPDRVGELITDWNFQPLLPAFWEEVLHQAHRTPLLGERFAAARRTFERRWGCHNLELPVSRLCQTPAFAWFACHLLAHLDSFHAIYNACVHAYRQKHGLRSRHHPVPDLAAEGEWLETPFWGWRMGAKRRGRLFARQGNQAIHLRVGSDNWPAVPLPSRSNGESLAAAWLALLHSGYKLRSRALTNTLYARLFLADLFIHGIGGGRYDEVTDDIIRRFYGFEPPAYMILSATLLLPLPAFPARPEDRENLAWQLHDQRRNPQRHLDLLADLPQEAFDLGAQKQSWIARAAPSKRARRERFHALRSLTEKLRPFLSRREHEVQEELARCEADLMANGVLRRRDYAFPLYPEPLLRAFCMQFLANTN
jgi:hypothetical protein